RRRRRRRRRRWRRRRRRRRRPEVINHAQQQAVRDQVAAERVGRGAVRTVAQLRDVEVAVLQADIDVRTDGIAHPGDRLERQLRRMAVNNPRARRVGGRTKTDVGEADAAADIAAQGVLIAEVEQGVEHARQDIQTAAIKVTTDDGRDRSYRSDPGDARMLVAKLAFEAKPAEIVSGNRVDVETGIVVDYVGVWQ